MKKKLIPLLIAIAACVCILSLAACGNNTDANGITAAESMIPTSNGSADAPDTASDEAFVQAQETTADFTIASESRYAQNNDVYTLVEGGTYTLQGNLTGQIVVDAEGEEVIIELDGVTITYDKDSPIKMLSASKVEISAKKGTDNIINDTRSAQTTDDDTQGKGAIYAKCDLKLKGNGVLIVNAGYNNGVHTTKDLTVKNLSLKITAVNNALKGNDSVTVESGTIAAISTAGDGIKTENTDLSAKGKQRGTVQIEDGTITVYAAGDGIQAAYDYVQNGGTVSVFAGSYSPYTASNASTTSYKGVKVGNELCVNNGSIYLNTYDDGLHADYGNALDNGERGKGNITISGGNVTVTVYSPTKSTAMGGFGRGGWDRQQSVKAADGIHADNTLTISGGNVNIDSAFEGLEANYINISGGTITVFATDDGVNACNNIGTPAITVSGGYLDVTVPTNGDTDGIDSNGTYLQTGGVVIARGPGSASGRMGGGAWALDTDRGVTLKGGTLVLFGGMEGTPSVSGMTKTLCSSSTVSAGKHTVTVGGTSIDAVLQYATSGCVVYSESGSATLR